MVNPPLEDRDEVVTAADDGSAGPSITTAAPAPEVRLRRVRGRFSIQSKLITMLLGASIVSAAVVGFIGYQTGQASLRNAAFDRLTQVRETQARQFGTQVSTLKKALLVYTSGPAMADALQAFSAGFNELANAPIDPAQQQAIVNYYDKELINPIEQATGAKLNIDVLLPSTNAAKYLQAHYAVPAAQPDRPAPVPDPSAWAAAATRYDPFFDKIVNLFGYGDALLIDPAGNIVYSAKKRADLGTNVLSGPYEQGNLHEAYVKAMGADRVDYVSVTDFQTYHPAGDHPVAWMGAPVVAGGRTIGVLALQLPITGINALMTFNGKWQDNGLGATGETYLAGADDLMRSNSRLFVENKEAFRREVTAAGTPAELAERAIRLGGTTLIQPVGGDATRAAQRGQTGTRITTDYLGQETLQSYAPVSVGPDVTWTIVAKIDTAEAFAPERVFTRTMGVALTAIVILDCLAAMALAQLFVRPIRRLETGAQKVGRGDYDAVIPARTRDEFGDLTKTFNDMSRLLGVKDDLLRRERQENAQLLRSLMPESVAERYRRGEETISESHQDVAVLFADIDGLDTLAGELPSDEFLTVVNELVRQFDDAAERNGVEPMRILRNGYTASCGLNVPRLDNVERIVAFAIEMQRIVARLNAEDNLQLGFRAGIDTGEVTSGLVGSTTMIYDMWGSAADLAYQIQAGGGEPGIYITSRVRDAVHDTHRFTQAGQSTVGDAEEPVWRLTGRR
ncbi:adenylate/guanylate cyclase domain-containing protein [Mycolicibacterium sp. CBMA 226]|uniref:adenylate/guanylate cyclase domain-containing protein n=1 Tax=Mycolicibacterium sp. CBMA 226 TaxID=2606611 RepID=UPI0012DF82F7|nr:adenylate/guanylate cyclase domain-containing protein [Mycolicibacterium sp. CBMA 226]MUL79128.1 HAMP domain-containing protein [Mycolicibacterium sp. CBMA 226]